MRLTIAEVATKLVDLLVVKNRVGTLSVTMMQQVLRSGPLRPFNFLSLYICASASSSQTGRPSKLIASYTIRHRDRRRNLSARPRTPIDPNPQPSRTTSAPFHWSLASIFRPQVLIHSSGVDSVTTEALHALFYFRRSNFSPRSCLFDHLPYFCTSEGAVSARWRAITPNISDTTAND